MFGDNIPPKITAPGVRRARLLAAGTVDTAPVRSGNTLGGMGAAGPPGPPAQADLGLLSGYATGDIRADRLARPRIAQRGRLDEPELKHRLRRLGQDLAMQREACLRRFAVVDRALNSMIPSTRANTYAGGAGPYGRQARRSGAFGHISA